MALFLEVRPIPKTEQNTAKPLTIWGVTLLTGLALAAIIVYKAR